MLVIDANVALEACGQEDGFQTLGEDLAAPPLMWSEARANLHRALINGEIAAQDAAIMHERLDSCPVAREDPPGLGRHAWEIAEQFGWGRTYDAEYIALARILKCNLVTIDMRLWRGAKRLGLVVTPSEVEPKRAPKKA
jgi:predicted nucleic acid-binding protein